jgi:hypothetical protein
LQGYNTAAQIEQRGDSPDARKRLLQQFQALCVDLRAEVGQTRNVSARPRETRYQAGGNGVTGNRDDDGDDRGRLLRGTCSLRPMGHDGVNPETNQFGRQLGQPVILFFCPTVFDDEVLALDVAQLAQAGPQRFQPACDACDRRRTEEPDPGDLRRLLLSERR